MVPKLEVVEHLDEAAGGVGFVDHFQDVYLDEGLVVELLAVLDDFQSDQLVVLVVNDLEDEAETAVAELVDELITVGHLLLLYEIEVAAC